MKILIIEDEEALLESMVSFLSSENYYCEKATDFRMASEKVALYEYACIILDINLPYGNGLEILKDLKLNNKTEGVLIVSARNSLDDKVFALKAGADDYLTKPFHLPELAARVSSIIRRRAFDGKNNLLYDALQLDLNAKTVMVQEQLIELTRKEYELLLFFISNRNKVISKSAIAEHLWGDEMDVADSYDFIYTHIKNLRKKLLSAGCPDYIKSIYGVGYKFTFS